MEVATRGGAAGMSEERQATEYPLKIRMGWVWLSLTGYQYSKGFRLASEVGLEDSQRGLSRLLMQLQSILARYVTKATYKRPEGLFSYVPFSET